MLPCQLVRTLGDEMILDIGSAQRVAVDVVYDIYPTEVDNKDHQNTRLT
jgi:hypothetical protein